MPSSIVILSEAKDLSGSPRVSLMRHPPVFMLSEAKHDRASVLCYLLWKDVINMRNDNTSNLATDGGSPVILMKNVCWLAPR